MHRPLERGTARRCVIGLGCLLYLAGCSNGAGRKTEPSPNQPPAQSPSTAKVTAAQASPAPTTGKEATAASTTAKEAPMASSEARVDRVVVDIGGVPTEVTLEDGNALAAALGERLKAYSGPDREDLNTTIGPASIEDGTLRLGEWALIVGSGTRLRLTLRRQTVFWAASVTKDGAKWAVGPVAPGTISPRR